MKKQFMAVLAGSMLLAAVHPAKLHAETDKTEFGWTWLNSAYTRVTNLFRPFVRRVINFFTGVPARQADKQEVVHLLHKTENAIADVHKSVQKSEIHKNRAKKLAEKTAALEELGDVDKDRMKSAKNKTDKAVDAAEDYHKKAKASADETVRLAGNARSEVQEHMNKAHQDVVSETEKQLDKSSKSLERLDSKLDEADKALFEADAGGIS